MSTGPAAAAATPIDAAYQAQRLRLAATVTAGVAATFGRLHEDRDRAISHVVQMVTAGQRTTAHLVGAYMTAKTIEATGRSVAGVTIDPANYTIDSLRGIPAAEVYARPFGAYGAFADDGADRALQAGQASVSKLAATDLQLAQTHAARDWMQQAAATATDELRIVGYRRVLSGPGPHCALCEAASTRTYKVSDLLPIHEHCTCGVQPLWGTEPVASIGTTVRVDDDPEIGPRLMADHWSSVGPRLTT